MTNLESLPEQVDRVESQIVQLRAEVHEEFSGVRGEFRTVCAELQRGMGEEIRAGDEETRQLMRVLHEDVITRFALLEEGRTARKKRKRPTGRE